MDAFEAEVYIRNTGHANVTVWNNEKYLIH